MMWVDIFDKDLMAHVAHRLEKREYSELVELIRLALHTVLDMAEAGYTISDISLCNLCYHRGLIKIADWGCGYTNAPIKKLRESF